MNKKEVTTNAKVNNDVNLKELESLNLDSIVNKVSKKRKSLYIYPKDLEKEDYKNFRKNLRNQSLELLSKFLFSLSKNENESSKKYLKEFLDMYFKYWQTTDFNLKNFSNVSKKENPQTLELYEKGLKFAKIYKEKFSL